MDKTKPSGQQGVFIFVTGLAGAGKTTLARELVSGIKKNGRSVVMLDGDELRKTIAEDLGHSLEDRRKAAFRYGRLAHLLVAQGVDVVLASISMFEEVRSWNRTQCSNYFEIYLRVSKEVLVGRNQKGLYGSSATQVVGIDLAFDEPQSPDIVVDNNGQERADQIAAGILEKIQLKLKYN